MKSTAFSLATLLVGAVLLHTPRSEAALITWSAPTTISADTDVSTTGTLVSAFNVGNASVGSTTINGVVFSPFSVPNANVSFSGGETSGNTTSTAVAGTVAPYTGLSSAYQALLRSGASSVNTTTVMTLSLGAFTVGQNYLVEFWASDSSASGFLAGAPSGNTKSIYGFGSNPVTLDNNSTDADGGLGQFVIGTFTADSPNQLIQIKGDGAANHHFVLNAFQVRALPVPEPGSAGVVVAFGLGAVALLGRTARRRA